LLTVLDFETSRFPDGNPYRKSAKAISWGASQDSNVSYSYYADPNYVSLLQLVLSTTSLLIVLNGKFDIGWCKRLGCTTPSGMRVWDCQIAEYVLSGQQNSFASMEQLCELYSIVGKQGGLEEWWGQGIETADIPQAIVEDYNIGDIKRTRAIYDAQLKDPRMSPKLRKLILLQGADLLVLQQMEQNGILYDRPASIAAGDKALQTVNEIKEELNELVDLDGFNFSSGDHLSAWLYGGCISVDRFIPVEMVYKSGPRLGQTYTQNKFQETTRREFPGLFKPLPKTALKKEGYYQTGEPILRQLPQRLPLQKRVIGMLLQLAELEKQVGSFLHALPALMEKNEWGDYLHPTYNQVVARTGRLSCSKPNAQQFDEVTDRNWISRWP
jgi:DNA polymerase I-like protein with 3'-5' exonuclease and polymerase domains